MIPGDNRIAVEGLGKIFEKMGLLLLKLALKIANNVRKSPGRVLDLEAKFGFTKVSKNHKAVLSNTPGVKHFD